MKTMIRNPFITSGYVSADYFCDRRFESEQLVREVMNGNNLALVSTRRMGKTGLIRHCFQFPEIKQGYYTFFIDIYMIAVHCVIWSLHLVRRFWKY